MIAPHHDPADPCPCVDERVTGDELLHRIYSAGEAYDAQRAGYGRSLHLVRMDGEWQASWRNGPLDPHTACVHVRFSSVLDALERLAELLEYESTASEDAAE